MNVVNFKKLYEDSILPKKAHETDAGMDLYAHSFSICPAGKVEPCDGDIFLLSPKARVLVNCGFAMALPEGFEAQIRPRSGLALKKGITVINSPGTIDYGWRGPVGVILLNTGISSVEIKKGDRIAQMVIQKLSEVTVVETDELPDPGERYGAGYGSTDS